MLKTVWECLKPHRGRSLMDSSDKCGEKLQLHLSGKCYVEVYVCVFLWDCVSFWVFTLLLSE